MNCSADDKLPGRGETALPCAPFPAAAGSVARFCRNGRARSLKTALPVSTAPASRGCHKHESRIGISALSGLNECGRTVLQARPLNSSISARKQHRHRSSAPPARVSILAGNASVSSCNCAFTRPSSASGYIHQHEHRHHRQRQPQAERRTWFDPSCSNGCADAGPEHEAPRRNAFQAVGKQPHHFPVQPQREEQHPRHQLRQDQQHAGIGLGVRVDGRGDTHSPPASPRTCAASTNASRTSHASADARPPGPPPPRSTPPAYPTSGTPSICGQRGYSAMVKPKASATRAGAAAPFTPGSGTTPTRRPRAPAPAGIPAALPRRDQLPRIPARDPREAPRCTPSSSRSIHGSSSRKPIRNATAAEWC